MRPLVVIAETIRRAAGDTLRPQRRRLDRRLASFSRLIAFDKRGTGMSERVVGAQTLETCMDDLRAVMDAADSSRAAIFGMLDGSPMSLLFAQRTPRTSALVLLGGFALRGD